MKYLEKTFKVPSNGVFGGPKSVTLREMTTREEKILLGTRDNSVFERLVKSCCVDEEIDFNKLHQLDVMYLVFMLRELTYGPEYMQEHECPHCGAKQEITVNINEMNTTVLSDEQAEKLSQGITIELSTGDKMNVHTISIGDSNEIDKIVKSKVKQNKIKDIVSFELMVKLAYNIDSIILAEPVEGLDLDNLENKIRYLDQIRMKDLQLIKTCLNDFDFGLNRNVYRNCENCGEEMEVTGYIVPEFFYPSK